MAATNDKPEHIPKDSNDIIYWVERYNPKNEETQIFMMNKKECQRKFYENTSIYNYEWRFIGRTDGETLRNEQKKNREEIKELEDEKKKYEERLEKFVEKEDELLFDELVDDDDERLQRVEERQEEMKDKIHEINEELSEKRGAAFEEAYEKELQKARENDTELPEPPEDVLSSNRNSPKQQEKLNNMLNERS